MDEYAKANAGGNHPYRKWEDFALLMVRQAEQVRRLGGELFPMLAWGQVGWYQTIFTLAAGAHSNAQHIPSSLGRFATRNGELLWGANIRNIWNPLGLVVVRPGIMWENYVREERLDKRRKRLIVHLINPPAQESATETLRLEKEEQERKQKRFKIAEEAKKNNTAPDFSELDSQPPILLEPKPQSNIAVRIVPEAMEGKWNASRAFLLSADDGSRTEIPIDKSDPYFWQVMVPELKYWSIIVIELEKK
jgi:hypothetical protein